MFGLAKGTPTGLVLFHKSFSTNKESRTFSWVTDLFVGWDDEDKANKNYLNG